MEKLKRCKDNPHETNEILELLEEIREKEDEDNKN